MAAPPPILSDITLVIIHLVRSYGDLALVLLLAVPYTLSRRSFLDGDLGRYLAARRLFSWIIPSQSGYKYVMVGLYGLMVAVNLNG